MDFSRAIIMLALLITLAILPFGCAEPASEEEIVEDLEETPVQEEEPDEAAVEPEEDELEEDKKDDDQEANDEEPASQPAPSSTIEHQVDMNVNGTVERDKGEEWWKLED